MRGALSVHYAIADYQEFVISFGYGQKTHPELQKFDLFSFDDKKNTPRRSVDDNDDDDESTLTYFCVVCWMCHVFSFPFHSNSNTIRLKLSVNKVGSFVPFWVRLSFA